MKYHKFSPTPQQFYSTNFNDIVEVLIPNQYLIDDLNLSGLRVDPLDQIINTHIELVNNIYTVLPLSAGTTFSSLVSFHGIEPFFIKQNNLTKISAESFERNILNLDNKSFQDFTTSSEFSTYVKTDLMPKIFTNAPSLSSIDYLTTQLGWFYFLAGSGVGDYQPSSSVAEYFVTNLYRGGSLGIDDGINALTEYLWYNQDLFSDYIPDVFLSGTGEYTSGIQSLEKLKTLNTILYSTAFIDQNDTKVRDAFYAYEQTGDKLSRMVSNGPLWKLVKAFSFAFAGLQDEANSLATLYDLQDCPDELLPELARLIGWKLLGYDPNKWRLQLANAVNIYKKAGTKQSIQAAVNSVFTEGAVDLGGIIYELWESYIPFLILYALATESNFFKDLAVWTPEKARSLGLLTYSNKNIFENLQLATDKILQTLFEEFPEHFILGGKEFPIDDPEFVFNYRNAEHKIPPYEEIPYYLNCDISIDFLFRLTDLLVCFGVPEDFAYSVKNYIYDNTIGSDDELQESNRWLFFTASSTYPSNWESIVSDPTFYGEEYLSLWNGKSSHYKMIFSGTNFDFAKTTYEVDSKEVILIAAKAAEMFAPAHAINDILVFLGDSDDYDFSGVHLPVLEFSHYDHISDLPSSVTFANRELSGIDIATVSGKRDAYNSLYLTNLSSTTHIEAPRNVIRRRSYHNVFLNFYDRTGYNMPVSYLSDLSSTDENNFALGFIPSALTYNSVDASCGYLSSLDAIYDKCSANTSSIIFGFDTSNVVPSRGERLLFYGTSAYDLYPTRGATDSFIALINQIEYNKLLKKYEQFVEDNEEIYGSSLNWYNLSGSLANQEFTCSATLSSFEAYENYYFGNKLHNLFSLYTSSFERHGTNSYIWNTETSSIGTHTFGNFIPNGEFSTKGPDGTQYYATSIESAVLINSNSEVFSSDYEFILANGITIASSLEEYVVSSINLPVTYEYVNSSIISDVELVYTSGVSEYNNFAVYSLAEIDGQAYAHSNTLVRMQAVNGLPRIRIRIKSPKFLLADCDYLLKLKALITTVDYQYLGGNIGIWLHTDDSWHFTKDRKWEYIDNTNLNIPFVLENLTHILTIPDVDRSKKQTNLYQCLTLSSETGLSGITALKDSDFSELEFTFDTKNKKIRVPNEYFVSSQQVHTKDQEYIIEIFQIPSQENIRKFALIDFVWARNDTLFDMTKIEVSGTPTGVKQRPFCKSKFVQLTSEEVRLIFQYWNYIAGKSFGSGISSRDSVVSYYYTLNNGGSRISSRLNPRWLEHVRNASSDSLTSLIL